MSEDGQTNDACKTAERIVMLVWSRQYNAKTRYRLHAGGA